MSIPEQQHSDPAPRQTSQDKEHLALIAKQRRSRAVKLSALLALVLIFIVFVLSNSQPVPVDYVLFERQPPMIWVMFGCAVIGGIVGFILGRPGRSMLFHRAPKRPDKKPQ